MTVPPLRSLRLATGMLTVVRLPVPGEATMAELRASTALYPMVGLGVGVVPALVLLLPLPVLPRAALALALWVAVTGALHLDGWADCCDAAFAPPRATPEQTRERRLAILRDPHVGTFGVVGLVLLLLGKWSALAQAGPLAPLLAAPVARWSMVLLLRSSVPARTDGLASTFAGRVPLGRATLVLTGALLLPMLLLPVALWVSALGAVAAGVLAALAAGALLARRFGGLTGDVCGAGGEAAELVVLWALLPWGVG